MRLQRDFEHRDRLIAAALEEFSERGYENASINAILAAAGMSKGQFYHHFGNKQGLYLAVVELLIHRKREHFAAHPVPPGGDFFDTLKAQLVAGRAFARDNPDIERFSQSFLRERGQPIHQAVLKHFGFDQDAAMRHFVAHAYERGDFHPDLSLDFVHRAVVMVLDRVPELLDLQAPEEMDARVDELIGFLRRGLGRC